MLATLLFLGLTVAVLSSVGASTLARRRPGGAALVEHVVAGVLTLPRLEERRRSVLLPTQGHPAASSYRRDGTLCPPS